ncbi:GerAB/ArcD/ProY family transporter [Priestia endophytica]|uniref:GerAB/ArcD/ProY family transporter n=1 Tax=Priestia endophytica TaxID=135735 RepID=UPI003AF1F8AE
MRFIAEVLSLGLIERLDAIVVFPLLITALFKPSILLYATIRGIVDLFKLNHDKKIILQ